MNDFCITGVADVWGVYPFPCKYPPAIELHIMIRPPSVTDVGALVSLDELCTFNPSLKMFELLIPEAHCDPVLLLQNGSHASRLFQS